LFQFVAVLSAFENKNRYTIKSLQMCKVIRSVYSTLFQLTPFHHLQKMIIFATHHSYQRHSRSMDSVWKSYLINEQTVYLSEGHSDHHRKKRQVWQKSYQED